MKKYLFILSLVLFIVTKTHAAPVSCFDIFSQQVRPITEKLEQTKSTSQVIRKGDKLLSNEEISFLNVLRKYSISNSKKQRSDLQGSELKIIAKKARATILDSKVKLPEDVLTFLLNWSRELDQQLKDAFLEKKLLVNLH